MICVHSSLEKCTGQMMVTICKRKGKQQVHQVFLVVINKQFADAKNTENQSLIETYLIQRSKILLRIKPRKTQ